MTTLNITAVPAMTLTVSDGTQSVGLAVEPAPELTLVMGAGQGPSGPQGIQGNSITNIARTSGTGAAGTTDTYTIYYSDNTTDTFQLYNGQNGNYIYEGVPVVQQTDIGTEPNEIPLNQYLGSMAYQDREQVSVDSLTVPTATPNSVAYFNGSKALTTGSALTFDGASLGIGTSSPLSTLAITQDKAVTLLSTTDNHVIGYNLRIQEGSNNRRAAFFLDDATGEFGLVSTATTGVPNFALRLGGLTPLYASSSGNVGIGTSSPGYKLDVSGSVRIRNGLQNGIVIGADNSATTTTDSTLKVGAISVPHYLNAQVPVGVIAGLSTSTDNVVEIGGNTGSLNSATQIRFYTAATTTTGLGTERLRVDSTGNVLVTSTGGLGYGTGSGGAVTQITSRTAGVTLNKTNGAITLVSAAGSATWQSFTVTNSTVAATDVVKVCQKSGTDLYMIHVTAVAAGSFRITFATTGGTTTEQPVFNFAVIKAVTA